jgi:hypothetical protein
VEFWEFPPGTDTETFAAKVAGTVAKEPAMTERALATASSLCEGLGEEVMVILNDVLMILLQRSCNLRIRCSVIPTI